MTEGIRLPEVHDRYGSWRVNRRACALVSDAGGYEYELDLETDFATSAQMLDCIMQIADKNWGTPEVIGDLVRALNDIFRPQTNLCGSGAPKMIPNLPKFVARRLSSGGQIR
jgi:hypothetical protein